MNYIIDKNYCSNEKVLYFIFSVQYLILMLKQYSVKKYLKAHDVDTRGENISKKDLQTEARESTSRGDKGSSRYLIILQ